MKLSHWLYNSVIHAGLPVVTVGNYLAFQGRNPERHTSLKFAVPSTERLSGDVKLWLHCASVGEAGLVNQLLKWSDDIGISDEKILVTTQTLSGLEQVQHSRKVLLPYDYPGLIGPVVRRVNADCLVVLETEIWPNLYRMHPNKLVLLNARIGDKTFERYRFIEWLTRDTLSHCDLIVARNETDRERIESLAPETVPVELGGNLKWTRALEASKQSRSITYSFEEQRPVIVVGSTHEGEEKLILESLREFEVNIILAPRHLDRLETVRDVLESKGYTWLNSSGLTPQEAGKIDRDVLLLDEFGQLEASYRMGDFAIIGGSWTSTGGHNLLESAQYGVPVISGPHLENFRASADMLSELGLLRIAENEQELTETVQSFLNRNEEDRTQRIEDLREQLTPIARRYRETLSGLLDEA